MVERLRLVVLFGGRSAEHDISCISARHVLDIVDRSRYEVVPIGITRDGRWVAAAGAIEAGRGGSGPGLPSPDSVGGEPLDAQRALVGGSEATTSRTPHSTTVVLPLLHGPMGEDGTLQGLLELVGVPYVGAGVLGSALCMDKSMTKEVLAQAGLPQARWRSARITDVTTSLLVEVAVDLGWPIFVKPANLGSSIGITKATDTATLQEAVELASRYDDRIVFEETVWGREIEVAVLGNSFPRASVPGEIVPSAEFYDYSEKYVSDGAKLLVPAPLSASESDEVRGIALRAFEALRVEGMARVDFFYEERRGWLVNEVNTIPGFTSISMYPRLWEATGLSYPELLDELVELALERHRRRSAFSRDRHQEVD